MEAHSATGKCPNTETTSTRELIPAKRPKIHHLSHGPEEDPKEDDPEELKSEPSAQNLLHGILSSVIRDCIEETLYYRSRPDISFSVTSPMITGGPHTLFGTALEDVQSKAKDKVSRVPDDDGRITITGFKDGHKIVDPYEAAQNLRPVFSGPQPMLPKGAKVWGFEVVDDNIG